MNCLRIERADSVTDPSGLLTLFHAMHDFVLGHKWSVSGADLWLLPDSPAQQVAQARRAAEGVEWLDGSELLALVACVTVVNWGAFLAFTPSSSDLTFGFPPRSEGEVHPIQHPLAVAEVQAVDGGYFEVYSRLPEVHAVLQQKFVGAYHQVGPNQVQTLNPINV